MKRRPTPVALAKQFGDAFAAPLEQLPPGRWYGLVDSGYGAHLVFITERTGGGKLDRGDRTPDFRLVGARRVRA